MAVPGQALSVEDQIEAHAGLSDVALGKLRD